MSIRHPRSENFPATTQNSQAKFCLFPERALPFHYNPPVTLQYSPATPIHIENPAQGTAYSCLTLKHITTSNAVIVSDTDLIYVQVRKYVQGFIKPGMTMIEIW